MLREETRVVNTAMTTSTPAAAFSPTLSATAKTGIDECVSSLKTMFWSINSTPPRKSALIAQVKKISFAESFFPSLDMIMPPMRTSSPA